LLIILLRPYLEVKKMEKLWILFQKNIKKLFYLILILISISDFLIHRHNEFSIGKIHLFEAFCGLFFIFLLSVGTKIFKLLLFKPENYYKK